MCLSLDEKTRTGIKYGYKIFKVVGNKIYGEYFSYTGAVNWMEPYKKKKWYKSSSGIIGTAPSDFYERGFHIFTNKKHATSWRRRKRGYKIFKVKLKNIIASGIQGRNLKVVVAKEMMILEEVE